MPIFKHSFKSENSGFSALPAKAGDAEIIASIFDSNLVPLHADSIPIEDWRELLSANDPDEAHFVIVRFGDLCAWLKINGLLSSETAWISMLAVSPEYHRKGAGSFAVSFAEEFICRSGKSRVCIHTTEDNIPARSLCKSCGYSVTEYCQYTTGDGTEHMGYTFEKELRKE